MVVGCFRELRTDIVLAWIVVRRLALLTIVRMTQVALVCSEVGPSLRTIRGQVTSEIRVKKMQKSMTLVVMNIFRPFVSIRP